MFLSDRRQSAAQAGNVGVDIKTVDRIDPQREDLPGLLLDAARRCAQHSHIDPFEFLDRIDHTVPSQFVGHIRRITAHDARHFKIGRCIQRLQHIPADIAVTHYGCFDLFHRSYFICLVSVLSFQHRHVQPEGI